VESAAFKALIFEFSLIDKIPPITTRYSVYQSESEAESALGRIGKSIYRRTKSENREAPANKLWKA
jgi:hypothetical protein